MIWLIILFFCTFLYMEAVYHIACFGFAAVNPLIAVFIWLFLAGFASLLMGFPKKEKPDYPLGPAGNRLPFVCVPACIY